MKWFWRFVAFIAFSIYNAIVRPTFNFFVNGFIDLMFGGAPRYRTIYEQRRHSAGYP